MCTTEPNRAETVLFRSYDGHVGYTDAFVDNAMQKGRSEITISLAVNGGLLNNNPIDHEPEPPIPKSTIKQCIDASILTWRITISTWLIIAR